MQDKELTEDSSSDSIARHSALICQISRDYPNAAGVVVTGPDASDVYLVGGGE